MRFLITTSVLIMTLITGAVAMAGEMILYDFSDPDSAAAWMAVHDTVMGGVSSGGMETTAEGTLVFAGVVSLENNGGFASMRSLPRDWDLGAYDGLEVRLRGDGKRYRFNLKTDNSWDGILYRVPFETTEGEWITVRLPFSEFVAGFRGRPVPGAPALDSASIKTLGVLISDRQEGPFRLEIDSIGVYVEKAPEKP